MLRLNIASNSPTLNALSRPERRRETAAERLGDDGDQPVGVGLGADAVEGLLQQRATDRS